MITYIPRNVAIYVHVIINTYSVTTPYRDCSMTKLRGVLVIVYLLPAAFGCSCPYPPGYSTPLGSLCNDYERSSDVFVARVINASCNCNPPSNDSSYGPANISCLAGDISEYFTTEVVYIVVAVYIVMIIVLVIAI